MACLRFRGMSPVAGSSKPGFVFGILNISGNYTQESDGVLQIEVGGLSAGESYDQLRVTGAVSVAGRLDVQIVNGFLPCAGDPITVLQAGSVTGTYDCSLPPIWQRRAMD